MSNPTQPKGIRPRFSLCDVIPNISIPTVVDIGAMIVEGHEKTCGFLAQRGMVKLICFEPNEEECKKVNALLGPPHQCFPYFIADGSERTFYETNHPMTGSLYEPNTALLDLFRNLNELTILQKTHKVKTKRLDDIAEIDQVDMLKMDIQGAEVDVSAGAPRLLANTSIVQTEVTLIEMYKGQALWADTDRELRSRGFMFHTITGFSGRALKPFLIQGNRNMPVRQLLWTDAIYVRDITKLDQMSIDSLLKYALLMNDELGSIDFCFYILQQIDRRENTNYGERYQQALAGNLK